MIFHFPFSVHLRSARIRMILTCTLFIFQILSVLILKPSSVEVLGQAAWAPFCRPYTLLTIELRAQFLQFCCVPTHVFYRSLRVIKVLCRCEILVFWKENDTALGTIVWLFDGTKQISQLDDHGMVLYSICTEQKLHFCQRLLLVSS